MELIEQCAQLLSAYGGAGIDAGKAIALEKGLLVNTEVIPSPSDRLWTSLF
jgi:hypothetical protein